MSTVFTGHGPHAVLKHLVAHLVRDDRPDDLVKVVVHSYCGLVRIFQRGNPLLEDGVPTCFACVLRHGTFIR